VLFLVAILTTTVAAQNNPALDLLEQKCARCHTAKEPKGGLSLATHDAILNGGDSGAAIVHGQPDESLLIDLITPNDKGKSAMPDGGPALNPTEIDTVRRWIADGAKWPNDRTLQPEAWWSFRPLHQPKTPTLATTPANGTTVNPIDAFVRSRLNAEQAALSPEADRRTLIRRLSYDLTGLPPTWEEVQAFENNTDPRAYEQLVDRLLASPHYGERWARHWLDVVHFGETHGYDKDKLRLNAWPYRDYVIRAFNDDKPYWQCISEQIAGDVEPQKWPVTIEALGFIAAGPWDFIAHAEVSEDKIDGKIARHLDRDDMVRNTMETFCSLTVGCAQCHDHKFDPISQHDYYSLQAVFAALDRADREYDVHTWDIEKSPRQLREVQTKLIANRVKLLKQIYEKAGTEFQEIDKELIAAKSAKPTRPPEYGYHSAIAPQSNAPKWVQVDLGKPTVLSQIVLIPCEDDFNNIGAGFGFPGLFRIEGASDAEFTEGVITLVDETKEVHHAIDVEPLMFDLADDPDAKTPVRYLRVTATQLAERQNDYIFAMSELQAFAITQTDDDEPPQRINVAAGKPVTALDSVEAPVRWRKSNLVDGLYPRATVSKEKFHSLTVKREAILTATVDESLRDRLQQIEQIIVDYDAILQQLPPPTLVYAGTVHNGTGTFRGTGPDGGEPRVINRLERGDVTRPAEEVEPAAPSCLPISGAFDLPETHSESDRRLALANWLTHQDNPLVWRSIVNRVWQYHFGTGLVDTPNDFGRMGGLPSHPELLDWLAADFRDNGQSFKRLHRLIVLSETYRQSSLPSAESETTSSTLAQIDSDNRLLWRQNRRRLEAEAVRDAILQASGKLDLKLGGPSFQDFVIKKPQHSPHYEYDLYDPTDPATHRRSIYRFLVRSQTQPLMTVLDCADPSIQVAQRNETVSPLQALALLNNRLILVMSQAFAERIQQISADPEKQAREAIRIALQREPDVEELRQLTAFNRQHGLENLCRAVLNMNEFVFVD